MHRGGPESAMCGDQHGFASVLCLLGQSRRSLPTSTPVKQRHWLSRPLWNPRFQFCSTMNGLDVLPETRGCLSSVVLACLAGAKMLASSRRFDFSLPNYTLQVC